MFGKPLHGTFASPNAKNREQAAAASKALAGAATDPSPSAPAPRERAPMPPLGLRSPDAVAGALGHIGDGLHRIADAMAARYELDLAADERHARTWDRFAELAERFAARIERDEEASREPPPNRTEVSGAGPQ